MARTNAVFLLVCDSSDGDRRVLSETLSRAGVVDVFPLGSRERPLRRPSWLVVDIDLSRFESVALLRDLIRQEEVGAAPRMFMVDAGDHQAETQALALQADRLIVRPIQPQSLLKSLRADMAADFKDTLDRASDTRIAMGVRAAHDVIETMFEELPLGGALSVDTLDRAESVIVGSLRDARLGSWLDTVKLHHSSSYRHCLLVAGAATCFAQHIGASERDQKRVARAALVHDIGKAFTPLSILDKPDGLTKRERAELNLHPRLGCELLKRSRGVSDETLEAVVHHHELLDGSGYPDGLSAGRIEDLTRMITIADIFSALVEERSYKRGYSRSEALAIMRGMAGKLDRALLGAFGRMVEGDPKLTFRAAPMRHRPAA